MTTAAPLIVVIPHCLGQAEVMRRLKPGLSNAAASFPLLTVEEESWSANQMTFRVKALGQSASGTIEATENFVRLEVMLPTFIARFAEKIRAVVESRGRLPIEKN